MFATLKFMQTTTGTRREVDKAVCASLNQRGTHVLFGVTNDGNAV